MNNWKTTISGIVTAICAFILFSPDLFKDWPLVIALAKFAGAGGMVTFGIFAKDHNVTGGTKPQGGFARVISMFILLILSILLIALQGCAYNSVTITADNGSKVTTTATVDKPVSVDTLRKPTVQGNVPLQGGTVNNPQQNVTGED